MKRHIVHTTGQSPYAIDRWQGPYQTEKVARSIACQAVVDTNDFVSKVYHLSPETGTMHLVAAYYGGVS